MPPPIGASPRLCRRRGGDIRVCATSILAHLANVLSRTAVLDRLIVVERSSPALIADLVGSQGRSLMREINCSVMIFHED
jgi:hypothetical protein